MGVPVALFQVVLIRDSIFRSLTWVALNGLGFLLGALASSPWGGTDFGDAPSLAFFLGFWVHCWTLGVVGVVVGVLTMRFFVRVS